MSVSDQKKTAIIAGDGILPVILAKRLHSRNMLSLLIIIQGNTNRFSFYKGDTLETGPGRVNKILKTLEKKKINNAIILGKVDKKGFIERKGFDIKALKLLKSIKDGKDLSIFDLINNEFRMIGVEILPQDEFLKDMIAPQGTITKKKPTALEMQEALFGIKHASQLASMDIGQTLVVKNRTIIAAETAEGTNETIRRGASIGRKNSVICKAARKNQDRRFDIPGIGIETLEIMLEHKCRVLAVEAGSIFLIPAQEVIEYANRNKMCIIGLNPVMQ